MDPAFPRRNLVCYMENLCGHKLCDYNRNFQRGENDPRFSYVQLYADCAAHLTADSPPYKPIYTVVQPDPVPSANILVNCAVASVFLNSSSLASMLDDSMDSPVSSVAAAAIQYKLKASRMPLTTFDPSAPGVSPVLVPLEVDMAAPIPLLFPPSHVAPTTPNLPPLQPYASSVHALSAQPEVPSHLRTPFEQAQLRELARYLAGDFQVLPQRLSYFVASTADSPLHLSQQFSIAYPSPVGTKVYYPLKAFLDGGASYPLIDVLAAQRLRLSIFKSPLGLRTADSNHGQVLGITALVQFGYGCDYSGGGILTPPRAMLVTSGMHDLYDVLVPNMDNFPYKAEVTYGGDSVTYHHGNQHMTLPLFHRVLSTEPEVSL